MKFQIKRRIKDVSEKKMKYNFVSVQYTLRNKLDIVLI